MASTSARLLALAARHPDPADAAELRALADEVAGQRRRAGRASAAARGAQASRTKADALGVAQATRRANSAASQEEVAGRVKAAMGAVVPGEDGLRRWVAEWEADGDLPRRLCGNGVDAQTPAPNRATTSPRPNRGPARRRACRTIRSATG